MAVADLPLPCLGDNIPGLPADNEEEYFDIVDHNNHVIGREKRSIVHATGLKHRAVYCFVFNEQGKLLMQQRSPRQAPSLHVADTKEILPCKALGRVSKEASET